MTTSRKTFLTPFAHKLLIGLLILELVLVGLHFVRVSRAWNLIFGLGAEFMVGATFSAMQLGSVALVALTIAVWGRRSILRHRLFWIYAAAVFVMLSIDEYFQIHEHIPFQIYAASYAFIGVLLAASTLALFWFSAERSTGLVVYLFGGLALMAFGGLFLEFVALGFCGLSLGDNLVIRLDICGLELVAVEEFLEMSGVSLALSGMLSYGEAACSASKWRLARRLLGRGSALYAISLVIATWFAPILEANFIAQPVVAEYAESSLSLIGYTTSRDVAAPGDTLRIVLYWRANRPLSTVYHQSSHLVTHPEVTSQAQTDRKIGGALGGGTAAWLSGAVMRDVYRIELPEDLLSPQSYWLTIRVWSMPGDSPSRLEGLALSETDRHRLAEDTIVVTSLPVLADDAAFVEPQSPTAYYFADGFTLSGYTLPATGLSGSELVIDVRWQSQQQIAEDFTQFFHLFHSNGEHFVGFDQPPFADKFPTSDWPAGIDVVNHITIPLPPAMTPGEYRVHTGMYLPATGERLLVTDAEGQPVRDNSIFLGTVIIEAPEN